MIHKINEDIEKMDVEILLVNTLTVTADKVQMVINNFLQGETYTSIFCFTKAKVDNPDFKPVGIKLFTKQRKRGDKKRWRPNDRLYM